MWPGNHDQAGPRALRGLAPPVQRRVTRATFDAVRVAYVRRPAHDNVTVAASIIYLGLDVHKDSGTVAVLPVDATPPTRIDKHPNDFARLRRAFERLAKDGEIRACYEARGAGYGGRPREATPARRV